MPVELLQNSYQNLKAAAKFENRIVQQPVYYTLILQKYHARRF